MKIKDKKKLSIMIISQIDDSKQQNKSNFMKNCIKIFFKVKHQNKKKNIIMDTKVEA